MNVTACAPLLVAIMAIASITIVLMMPVLAVHLLAGRLARATRTAAAAGMLVLAVFMAGHALAPSSCMEMLPT